MRYTIALCVAAAAASLATSPAASAKPTGMNASSNASMSSAKCSAGDPSVILNTKTKTFRLDKSNSMKDGSMSMKKGGDPADKSHSMSSMKWMCKSDAENMGGKMMSGTKNGS